MMKGAHMQHQPAKAIAAETRIHLAATNETARSRATEALTTEFRPKQQQTGQIAKVAQLIATTIEVSYSFLSEVVTLEEGQITKPQAAVIAEIETKAAETKDAARTLTVETLTMKGVQADWQEDWRRLIEYIEVLLRWTTKEIYSLRSQDLRAEDVRDGWMTVIVGSLLQGMTTNAAHTLTVEAIPIEDVQDGQHPPWSVIARIGTLLVEITEAAGSLRTEADVIRRIQDAQQRAAVTGKARELLAAITKSAHSIRIEAHAIAETPDARQLRLAEVNSEIRDLLTKPTDSEPPLSEALAAMEKAGLLMARYRNTLTDREICDEPISRVAVDRYYKVKAAPAHEALDGINRFCGVKSWIEKVCEYLEPRRSTCPWRVIFFGLKADVEFAHDLYKLIEQSIEDEVEPIKKSFEYRGLPHNMRRLFLDHRRIKEAQWICDELTEMADEVEKRTKTASQTPLATVRNAVVEEAFGKLGITLD